MPWRGWAAAGATGVLAVGVAGWAQRTAIDHADHGRCLNAQAVYDAADALLDELALPPRQPSSLKGFTVVGRYADDAAAHPVELRPWDITYPTRASELSAAQRRARAALGRRPRC